jgi:hypothetical protein
VEVHAQRADRGRPPLFVDGERARPGAEGRDLREHVGLDLDALEPAARRDVALARRPAGRIGGGQQILALGHEGARALTAAPPGEPANFLELLVVGAGDQVVSGQLSVVRNKKGRRSEGAAPVEALASVP